MFSIFSLKQVNSFLADKNSCVILCEFLNKIIMIVTIYYYYCYHCHNILLLLLLLLTWQKS